jgi:serine/threonine-protein kinase
MDQNISREEAVFQAALEMAQGEERAAYLEAACGTDAQLRCRVEALLRHCAESQGPLDRFPAGLPPTSEHLDERHGTTIGPYKLMEQIGEGGMGLVFVAEQQQPLRRKVALKVIKPGMDTRQVIARFEAERQALALMDHPNIARVLDGGETASGRPYFVMELVKGVPITEYCDDNQLTPRQRLELFGSVCQAVQHAHQKGIIHRDIKPSNVLVTSHDGVPVVKVIDFGIAKAIGQQLTEKTVYTQFAQMVGTPLYMSPEQAGQSSLDIDTRTDIYSLGVLLYELLTGTTPFTKERLQEAGYDEMRRIIREEEPPRPSTRISTLGQAATTVSTHRKSDPKRLSQLFRGELDWIVMKALEKDRNRRYETPNGFAQDIERYLHDEPVLACPPSAWYRFGKFARRNKARLAVAGLILFFLVLLGGGVGWVARDRAVRQAMQEERVTLALREAAQRHAEGRWTDALAAARRAEELLPPSGGSGELRQQARQLRGDLEMVAELADIRLQSAAETDYDWGIARRDPAYAQVFRERGIDPAHGVDPLEAAQRIGAESIRVEVAAALDDWAAVCREWRPKADTTWKDLLAIARAADPDPLRNRLRDAWERRDVKALAQLAASEEAVGWPAPTVALLGNALTGTETMQAAVDLLRRTQQRHPADFWINEDLAFALFHLQPPQPDEAMGYYRAALALRPESPGVHLNLGNALRAKGRLDEAIAEFQEAIRLKNGADAHTNLGIALADKGRLDEAIAESREAIRLKKDDANAHCNLGLALFTKGRVDEAIAEYQEAIRLKKDYAQAHGNLGIAFHAKGRLDEAIAEYQEAIRLKKDFLAHYNLGIALADKGRLDQAIPEYQEAIRLKRDYAEAHGGLGQAFHAKGRVDEAIAEYREAIRLKKDYADAHYSLGIALPAKGWLDEAIAEYQEVIRLKKGYAEAHCNLGHALLAKGEFAQALASLRRGHELGFRNPRWPYPSAQWVRNCERLVELDEKLPDILSGKVQPADTAERLALADLCHSKKGYVAAAAGFYAEAFAREKKLLGDQPSVLRSNAAGAAALAGCGQGKDAKSLDEKERPRLRRQALDWLRADLAAWRGVLEKEPARARLAAVNQLRHWQNDPDFAGVRGLIALAKLPEAERPAWRQLWADVEETLRRIDREGPDGTKEPD